MTDENLFKSSHVLGQSPVQFLLSGFSVPCSDCSLLLFFMPPVGGCPLPHFLIQYLKATLEILP